MSRILARDCGFKMVFQFLYNEQPNVENTFEEYVLTDEEKNFSSSLLFAVKNNKDEIDNIISSNLKNGLKIKDIYKLDYSILLTAVAEINFLNESFSLVINEAVNLAKKYSTEKSPSFINGVLSSIYNKK